jgi:uncharacterized protein YbjT (DUF2867 family)
MRVILFGATGMIGAGVLQECLRDDRVESVVSVGRRPSGHAHAKLRDVIHDDFLHYDALRDALTGCDACFFCLGISSAGMSEEAYAAITYDATIAAAGALLAWNPALTFCYVSGAGTDSTERGRSMWARVKGRTENELLRLSTRSFMFRPGMIQPAPGVQSRTRLYRVFYNIVGPFMPMLRRRFPQHVTTSENLGHAMIEVTAGDYPKRILESADIERIAAATRRA